MLMSENIAILGTPPLGVDTGFVPDRVPPPGFVTNDRVIERDGPDWRMFPNVSTDATWMVGAMAMAAVALLGWAMNFRRNAAAALTVIVAVCAMVTVPFTIALTVFVSATVELNVPVACPLPFVGEPGWVMVLPLPVAFNVTVAPLTGFPNASRTVAVIVEALDPVLAVSVVKLAERVDVPASAEPAMTVTVSVCVIATVLIVAEMILAAAAVELSVPAAMPLTSVGAAGCVSVLPVPVAASATVAPCSGLPNASRAVTVMVEAMEPALAAIVSGAAETVDCAADTAAAPTVTVAV